MNDKLRSFIENALTRAQNRIHSRNICPQVASLKLEKAISKRTCEQEVYLARTRLGFSSLKEMKAEEKSFLVNLRISEPNLSAGQVVERFVDKFGPDSSYNFLIVAEWLNRK